MTFKSRIPHFPTHSETGQNYLKTKFELSSRDAIAIIGNQLLGIADRLIDS